MGGERTEDKKCLHGSDCDDQLEAGRPSPSPKSLLPSSLFLCSTPASSVNTVPIVSAPRLRWARSTHYPPTHKEGFIHLTQDLRPSHQPHLRGPRPRPQPHSWSLWGMGRVSALTTEAFMEQGTNISGQVPASGWPDLWSLAPGPPQ